jgi:hypothetical protein
MIVSCMRTLSNMDVYQFNLIIFSLRTPHTLAPFDNGFYDLVRV